MSGSDQGGRFQRLRTWARGFWRWYGGHSQALILGLMVGFSISMLNHRCPATPDPWRWVLAVLLAALVAGQCVVWWLDRRRLTLAHELLDRAEWLESAERTRELAEYLLAEHARSGQPERVERQGGWA